MKNIKLVPVEKIDGSERVINIFAKTGESTLAVNTCYNGSSDMSFGYESVTDWQWDESWIEDGIETRNIGSYRLPVDCDLVMSGTFEPVDLPEVLRDIAEICEPAVARALEDTQLRNWC